MKVSNVGKVNVDMLATDRFLIPERVNIFNVFDLSHL